MVIENNANEVVIRIPVSPQTIEHVQDAVDYFRYVELSSGFATPQNVVDDLAREVNSGWRQRHENCCR